MKKTKVVLIILILMVSIGLLGYGSYSLLKDGYESKKEKTTKEEKKKEEKKEEEEPSKIEIELSKTEITTMNPTEESLLTALCEVGTKIYNENKYSTYEKKNGAYFISLEQLSSDFEYDISNFKGEDGTVCNKELSGIYFDTEHQMGIEMENNPPVIPILIGCLKEENNQTPKA